MLKVTRGAKRETAVKKALCVNLYSLAKAFFNMMGKILGHSPFIIYRVGGGRDEKNTKI
ncbi:hypothetical protein [Holospora obtusa]|uniref:hypothetical protein n=1 Tax=Holospora obtusa TaxID=49893 RepID=UPI0012EB4C41|nr:hypothetical protein [Holospora obtusa]